MLLKNKNVLITGANSGIGLATAEALANLGATVIFGCRDTEAAEAAVANLSKKNLLFNIILGPKLDLMSRDSIRSFADYINKNFKTLDILINNAGVSFMKRTYAENIGGLAQTNYLGPYQLTRLLEAKLIASKARIVTLASVTHRSVLLRDPKVFLTDWRSGFYYQCKLASVLFAYELQRRLGNYGVTSCLADPGGVRSNIWETSPKFSKGFYKKVINLCYSPPADGCAAVVHAATVPWTKERKVVDGTPVMPVEDLRYYSRGLFTSPLITRLDGYEGKHFPFLKRVEGRVWGISTLILSLLDYPLRKATKGRFCSRTLPVRSATQTYDKYLAEELWDVSAEELGISPKPTLP